MFCLIFELHRRGKKAHIFNWAYLAGETSRLDIKFDPIIVMCIVYSLVSNYICKYYFENYIGECLKVWKYILFDVHNILLKFICDTFWCFRGKFDEFLVYGYNISWMLFRSLFKKKKEKKKVLYSLKSAEQQH